MIKNQRGITLIALVITIIILLILARVVISTLTGEDGLINKITIARKKQLESEAEEKLELKIMELQTEIVQKEGRQVVLEDLNNWTNIESDYYDQEIISVTDSQENTNKLVEIDGYVFEVDENLNIVGIIEVDITSKTETTYQINSIDGDVMQITIKIKNASGIEKVITPEGKEIRPQINKEEIAIDYEVTSENNYTFKVKVAGSDEIKEYVLKADVNAKPEIGQNESYAYPLLTEHGMEINKTVEINYGENTINYYSMDNGETWEKYTDKVKIQSECTLMAKTVVEGEITREVKKEITFELADDALGSDAYDGIDTTHISINRGTRGIFIDIDESAIGKEIEYNGTVMWMYFIDEEGNETISETIDGVTIPEGTKKIEFYNPESVGRVIYEVGINKMTIINTKLKNATLTSEGMKESYYNITLEYYTTAIEKLYKIDDEEWKQYNGENIKLEIGEIIYEKAIDKNNKEISNSSYTAVVSDTTLDELAFDGIDTTHISINRGTRGIFIDIDESAIGKKLKFIGGEIWIYFIDEEGKETESKTIEGVEIPAGTKRIEFRNPTSIGHKIYEVGINKE